MESLRYGSEKISFQTKNRKGRKKMIKIIKRETKFYLYLGTVFLGSFMTESDAMENVKDLILGASYGN